MKLRHIHLPNLTPYTSAGQLQETLVHRLLAYKASAANLDNNNTSKFPLAPPPTILSFQCPPTYTAGLRSNNRLTESEVEYLRNKGTAEFHYAPRGGQTTFHGPGQLVAYPIIDLRRHGLTARCYVSALEGAVIDTCASYGVNAKRTDNVGVWVTEEKKICAIGVHLRRHVSSHGIGLNVSTDTRWFDRIVACGLEGKGTTSLQLEGVENVTVKKAAGRFATHLALRLKGADGIDDISIDQMSDLSQLD